MIPKFPPENDMYRAKSELRERVRNATGEILPNTDFRIGWATVNHRKKKTHAITVLVNPECRPKISKAVMQITAEESKMYPVTPPQ